MMLMLKEKEVDVLDAVCVGHFIAEGAIGPHDISVPRNVYVSPVVTLPTGPDEQPELWAVWNESPDFPAQVREEFDVYEFESEARTEAAKRSTCAGTYDEERYIDDEPWDEV